MKQKGGASPIPDTYGYVVKMNPAVSPDDLSLGQKLLWDLN